MTGYKEINFFSTYIDNAFIDLSQEKPEHRVMFSRNGVKRNKRLNFDKGKKFDGYRKLITSLDIDSSRKEFYER